MSFRAYHVVPNGKLEYELDEGCTLFIRQAALSKSAKSGDHATLSVKVDGNSFIACRLRFGQSDQTTLDLPITDPDMEIVLKGTCGVDLMGYEEDTMSEDEDMEDFDPEMMMGESESEGESSEGESEESAPEAIPIEKLNPTPRGSLNGKSTLKPAASPKAKPAASPQAKPAASPQTKPAASPKTKPAASPGLKPAASPKSKPAASPQTKPAASPKTKPAPSPKSKPLASPGLKPISPALKAASPKASPKAGPSTAGAFMQSMLEAEDSGSESMDSEEPPVVEKSQFPAKGNKNGTKRPANSTPQAANKSAKHSPKQTPNKKPQHQNTPKQQSQQNTPKQQSQQKTPQSGKPNAGKKQFVTPPSKVKSQPGSQKKGPKPDTPMPDKKPKFDSSQLKKQATPGSAKKKKSKPAQ